MPLALDPQETFDLVLESDQAKPEAEQPTFTFRYLSNREWKQVAKTTDKLSELRKEGLDNMLTSIEEGLKVGLVDWKNIKDRDGNSIPYDPARLDDIIIQAEMFELLFAVRDKTCLGYLDKKKLESALPSSMDKSVESVNLPKPANQAQQN